MEDVRLTISLMSNGNVQMAICGVEHRGEQTWQVAGIYRGGDALETAMDQGARVLSGWVAVGAMGAVTDLPRELARSW